MRILALLHQAIQYAEVALTVYFFATFPSHDDLYWPLVLLSIATVVITNTASILLVKQTMDFQKKYFGLALCIFAHIIQCGSLWRTLKLLCLYEHADKEDMMKLKLVHICLISAPICTIFTNQYLAGNYSDLALLVSGFCFLNILSTLGYFSAPQDVLGAERTLMSSAIGYCWRLFTSFSRMSVFIWIANSEYIEWSVLGLVLHLTFMVVWCQLQLRVSSVVTHSSSRIWSFLLGVSSTIDLMGIDNPVPIQTAICYYLICFSEMVTIVVLKYYTGTLTGHQYQTLWVMAAFGSFTLGVAFAVISLLPQQSGNTTSTTQILLRCCCPGSKRAQLEKASLAWDSYDTRMRTPRCRQMYTASERQEHVDIINNPLGVEGAISLTHYSSLLSNDQTGATPPRSAVISTSKSCKQDVQPPNTQQVEADITPASSSVQTISTGNCLPALKLPPPYFLSPTGLRAIPASDKKSQQHEVASSEPRRRLLYLTPISLHPRLEEHRRSSSRRQLRSNRKDSAQPKWVDLNKLYGYTVEAQSHDVAVQLPEMPGSDDKVSEWLHEVSNQTKNVTTKFNPLSMKFETSL